MPTAKLLSEMTDASHEKSSDLMKPQDSAKTTRVSDASLIRVDILPNEFAFLFVVWMDTFPEEEKWVTYH